MKINHMFFVMFKGDIEKIPNDYPQKAFISSRKILLVKFVYCPDAKITILDWLNDDSLMLKYSSSARWDCNRNIILIYPTHTHTHVCIYIYIYLCILKQQ